MSVFGMIKDAIWGKQPEPAAAAPAPPAAAPAAAAAATPVAEAAPPTPKAPIDVTAILTQKAAEKGQPLNWQTSIVDLMKVLDLDPSHENRVSLAHELGYDGDIEDSATMNIWLHKHVMANLGS
ncbi:DUF3597 domain-containing protein [Sphingomonas psychrolutea]|uniref:DUF3597 domain-containing protein n=1 Tax=Sphingomonas psychrolutea TaxID=1259676 RepID=A0ABQ1GRZ4_9SPHN|nr:DUF3597 domain-containing protein [Sphingomonas psychrolutea]GGA49236.1 hypothetical protein GCM10011395_19450 [Sphingomonas psychrolutea]